MRIMDVAHLTDGANIEHDGESLLLAMLVKCHQDDPQRKAQRDVEVIMLDQNVLGDKRNDRKARK